MGTLMEKRKKGNPSKLNNILSYEERCLLLEKEIEMLQSLIPLRNYFNPIKHSRNSYIVELRRIIAVELKERGLSYKEIGRVFGKDHATVMHLLTIKSLDYVETEVLKNYKDWMEDMVYPETYPMRIHNEFSANGETSKIGYILVKKIPKHS